MFAVVLSAFESLEVQLQSAATGEGLAEETTLTLLPNDMPIDSLQLNLQDNDTLIATVVLPASQVNDAWRSCEKR